ncbi:MAG: RHS repeat-associated core domain-containing protein, partial [Candidatus Omnitrophica bacterium]|nr:RHS repeat-associated core domain-containing protein [Candidatus Omnitrophota bacterium]
KSPSEIAGQYVVTGQVRFNSQGLVQKEFVPYLSSRPFLADFRVADHFSAPAASSDNYATCGTLDSAVKGSVYDYDELGRMVKATGADGAYVSYVYTLSTDTVIDANGHKKVSVKDARGRVARVEEYSGADGRSKQYPATAFSLYAATTYEYDIKGNITRVLDASGNATTMSYDALGRKTDMSSPDMGLMRYAYDAAGQLTVQTDAQNMTTALVYDALGRLSSKASGGVSGANVAYTYDSGTLGVGRLSKVAYPSGSTAFGYDSVGAEIASTKTIDAKSYAVNKTYDALGRLKQIQYPDGKSTAIYQYNETGLLNSLQLKVTSGTTSTIQNIVTNVDYTPNGSVARIDYGNGAVALYTYNADNLRLAGLSVTGKTGAILQKNLYSYDAGGNIQQIQDAARGKTQTFQYDFLDRLIGSNDGSGALAYAYDQLGNIVQKGNITYTYGENGSGAHAVTSLSDGTRMTYDASGNMTSYRTAARTQYYSFDAYGRLTKVEAVNTGETARYTVAEYAYDGDGGRTKKTVYSSGNATTTYFVGALFDEVNGVKTDHLFIGGARVAAYDGSRVRWFIGDHLASTSTVLDETSALTERIDYTPWGEVKNYEKYGNTPEVAWFYFTGKKLDEESGLVYFGARYYNPKLGRFITADPIVQAPYNPQTLNRYTYCNNNPINLVDPTGHSWKNVWKATSVAVVGAVAVIATGGAATALLGAYWGGVFTGAMIGATVGGATAAAMGGNIGQGMLIGALGGAVFAGVAPGFNAISQTTFRSMSIGSGAYGPLSCGWSMGANFATNFAAGAVAGGTVAGVTGGDVGRSALIGGALAGGFSVISDAADLMRSGMVEQSRLDPRNASGKSVGYKGDGFKLGGGRFDPLHPNGCPSPLGGEQGGVGNFLGMGYKSGDMWDRIVEAYAGPHDFLNSWGYDAFGNLRNQAAFERFLGMTVNPLNVAVATPIVAVSVTSLVSYSVPVVIYGETQRGYQY